jgi:hypothetical protein
MKMTRDQLKGIVKECLVEILSEGLTSTHQAIRENRSVTSQRHAAEPAMPLRNPRSSTADKISFLPSRDEMRSAPAALPPRQNQQLARSLTSDPVLADIFADTARSGVHMNMNESAGSNHEQMVASAGDAAAKAMLRSDPVDVFGESAGKWAALAFSEKIPARS